MGTQTALHKLNQVMSPESASVGAGDSLAVCNQPLLVKLTHISYQTLLHCGKCGCQVLKKNVWNKNIHLYFWCIDLDTFKLSIMSPTLLKESSDKTVEYFYFQQRIERMFCGQKKDNIKSFLYQISQKNSSIYCSPFGVVKVKSRV